MKVLDGVAESPAVPGRSGPVGWFLNPYVQIGIGAVLVSVSEVLLKKGADAAPQLPRLPQWINGVSALASGWTWLGIIFYILSFASWIYVLRFVPLTIAFSLINAVHVLVPVAAWLLLREPVPVQRWVGIATILAGIVLVVGPATKAEEHL